MGKAIFGAAITGILGASVALYKNQLTRTYPFEGKWEMHVQRKVGDDLVCVWQGNILLLNNPASNTYVGIAEDGSSFSDGCRFGVKDVNNIGLALSKTDNVLTLGFTNFPVGATHSDENKAPVSLLSFNMKEEGGKLSDIELKQTTISSAFHVDLIRVF